MQPVTSRPELKSKRSSRVAVTLAQVETTCLLRLEGEVNIFSASELKKALMEALETGKDLRLDLESATDLDATTLQLLWAAGHEASQAGKRFGVVGPIPEYVLHTFNDAGMEMFPILPESS